MTPSFWRMSTLAENTCFLAYPAPRGSGKVFSYYTFMHPEFTLVDMRKIKSAGKIVYTTPSNWAVRKGGAFRDNPAQMHDHCADLVSRPIYKGAGY